MDRRKPKLWRRLNQSCSEPEAINRSLPWMACISWMSCKSWTRPRLRVTPCTQFRQTRQITIRQQLSTHSQLVRSWSALFWAKSYISSPKPAVPTWWCPHSTKEVNPRKNWSWRSIFPSNLARERYKVYTSSNLHNQGGSDAFARN